MNLEKALEMQASSWDAIETLYARLWSEPKADANTIQLMTMYCAMYNTACQALDHEELPVGQNRAMQLANAALEWANKLRADGGLTKANAEEVVEHIEELLWYLED